jgi:diadenosine tetraphosphate (Ap4A) HIT family hydrolase
MISSTQAPFALDAKLASDTVAIGDLPLSRVLLNDDSNYPWLILVPRRANVVELIDLDDGDRAQLMNEIALASAALRMVTRCDKLNVAALGNVVAQLHVHVIARFRADGAWPNPVWNVVPRRAYELSRRESLAAALRDGLQLDPVRR